MVASDDMEAFTQYGGASYSLFNILLYLVAMGAAGYFAWQYTQKNAIDSYVKIGLYIGGAVVGAWLLVFILRSLTINF